MPFQEDQDIIKWKVHLRSSPSKVYHAISTDEGRAKFWAESAKESGGIVEFIFPNGERWSGKVLENVPPKRFAVEYFGRSRAALDLAPDGKGGTEVTLTDSGVPPAWRAETVAGWVSVLMALKAAVDFSVDLRNHDPARTWDNGYVEN